MEEKNYKCHTVDEYKKQFKVFPSYTLESRLASGMMSNEAMVALRELLELRKKEPSVPQEVVDAFYSGALSEGVDYKLNDCVNIYSEDAHGVIGYVISIVTLEPEPRYLIELENGSDREYYQSELRLHSQ